MAEKRDKEKKLDFKKTSRELANIVDEKHINQIATHLTHEFLEHAKYKDKDGVEHFKEEFDQKDAEKLADKLYDALGYHLHKRFLKIPEDNYQKLKQIKDSNGNPYVDMITEYHFDLNRKDLRKTLGRKKKKNKISMDKIQKILDEPVQRHAGRIQRGILDKEHLTDPKNMNKLKGAIDEIVKDFKLDSEEFDTKEMYNPQEVLQTYVSLASKHYAKGAHAEKKK